MDGISDLLRRNTNATHQIPGFDFDFLWNQANLFNDSVQATDQALFHEYVFHPGDVQSRLTLTYGACHDLVGSDYTQYSREDVYDRVFLWRVPLVALLATATLPALGLAPKIFTFFHIFADPIDSLWSLFHRLEVAARNARWAENNDVQDEGSKFTQGSNKHGTLQIPGAESGQAQQSTAASQQPVASDNLKSKAKGIKEIIKLEQADMIRNDVEHELHEDMARYDLDVVALIVDAYSEWDYGRVAKEVVLNNFDVIKWVEKGIAHKVAADAIRKFRERCATAAAFISADHRSRGFPSVVTTFQFYFTLFAGFWKTIDKLSNTYDPNNEASVGLNRTPHNIAFGALYFWMPFAVLTTAFVGGAQTKNSIPRILERLREDVHDIHSQACHHNDYHGSCRHRTSVACSQSSSQPAQPDEHEHPCTLEFPELTLSKKYRWIHGGVPTWQPMKFREISGEYVWSSLLTLGCAVGIVSLPVLTAVFISYRTPTEGFGCRTVTQLGFLACWVFSVAFDAFLSIWSCRSANGTSVDEQRKARDPHQWIFWLTFIKDVALSGGAVAALTYTSVGIFNRCNCWTQWWPNPNERYISFPQEAYTFDILRHRIRTEFPIAVCVLLLVELTVFAVIAYIFWEGHRVLKQRDLDAVLHPLEWYEKPWHWIKAWNHRRKCAKDKKKEHLSSTKPRGESQRIEERRSIVRRIANTLRCIFTRARREYALTPADDGMAIRLSEEVTYYGGAGGGF